MSAVVEAPPALQLHGVVSGYGANTVLRGVSVTVPAASVTALLGPNGAGKTTLLKTVSGLIRPTSGSVAIDGEDVTRLSPNRRTARGLCHIPEGRGIFRALTVRDNLIMQSVKGDEADAVQRATEAFPILGDRLHQIAGTLSGGEQQMLAMARAYVRDPRLLGRRRDLPIPARPRPAGSGAADRRPVRDAGARNGVERLPPEPR
jgi:branched-chain amino acid transport system ATP-binding protein